jgi:CHAD domain-containing protein
MEIEAKFRAPDAVMLERLGEAADLAGYPIFAGRTEQLADTYLDTESWQMLAAGYACRRRVVEGRILVSVKQVLGRTDVVHRREELQVDLPGDVPPSDWPDSEARTRVLGIIGDQPFKEMLTLSQMRSTRWVGTIDRPLAEISLDAVRLEPSGTVFHEVEVELMKAGTEDDLAALVKVLQTEWALEPEPLSKFERALAASGLSPAREATAEAPADETPAETAAEVPEDETPAETAAESETAPEEDQVPPADDRPAEAVREVEPTDAATENESAEEAPPEDQEAPDDVPEPVTTHSRKKGERVRFLGDGLEVLAKPGISADDTMSEAANKLLLFHLQRMMQHEPGTREGEDAEELHDMRVATRRMRAALRVFADYLDAGEYKPFLKQVRTTGRELGAVRDLDVFRIKTQRYIDSLPPEEQSGLDPLMEAWAEERDRAREELIAYLDSARYQRFKEKFEHFLRTPGAGAGRAFGDAGEPLPTRVGDVLPGILFERLASVRAFDQLITRPDAPLSRFHELRIASKGLRYTLEFFQEALGPESKPLIETTKVVQDHLGDLQDAVVTCDVLLGFLGSGTWGPPRSTKKDGRSPFPVNAPGVAAFLAVKQTEIETLMATFGPVWDEIRSAKFSGPMAALLGAL